MSWRQKTVGLNEVDGPQIGMENYMFVVDRPQEQMVVGPVLVVGLVDNCSFVPVEGNAPEDILYPIVAALHC